jgi:probable rRNA maturation factor
MRRETSPRGTGPAGIEVICRGRGGQSAAAASRRLLGALRAATRRRRSGITLLLTSDREVRTLNRRFLGRDRSTDVLSFPSGGEREPGAPYLGEIAVSLPRARAQAQRARWPLRSEMALLVTHGYLHLLGHDHETDDGVMHRLEERLLRRVAGVRLERRALPWGDSAATAPPPRRSARG